MNELGTIETFIDQVMLADAQFISVVGTRWWKWAAHENAITPYGIYQLQSSVDFQGLGHVRILTRPVYLAKVVTKGFPDSNFDLAVNRIDEILAAQARTNIVGTDGQHYILSGHRIRPISYMERDPQTQDKFYHTGGLYRFDVSIAP